MMKILTREYSNRLVFELQGRLTGAWVGELEVCWEDAAVTHGNRELSVDLTGLTFVDQAGCYLLRLMRKEGVNLIGNDLLQQEMERPNRT